MMRFWFIPLAVLAVILIFSPEDWRVSVIYIFWFVALLTLAVTRIMRFIFVQRDWSLPAFSIVSLLVGLGLLGSAALTAPHPVYDYEWLRPWVRLCWALGLPIVIAGVHIETWMVTAQIKRRGQHDSISP